MRELMTFFANPREERGGAAVFFALALVILVGALGLSVDVGNVAYERTKAQHAADTAARQLAYQCARYPNEQACLTLQARAEEIASDSIDGAAVTAVRDITQGTVTVTVGKTIETNLLAMIGSPDKDVRATATAKFGAMQPTEAYNVLPLGVSYCTWKAWSNLAGTPQEATRKTTLRTDLLQGVENLLSPITSGLLDTIDTKGLTDQLGTDAVETCTDADGDQILTLQGAAWLVDQTVVQTLVGGLFNWDPANCELDIAVDLAMFVRTRTNSGFMPQGCPSHFGQGKLVQKNKTILLPIYKPASQLQDRLDFKVRLCASLFPTSATCAEVPPKIGVKIVGFAPFHVTGWRFNNPNDLDPSVPTCQDITLRLNLRSLIQNLLGTLQNLLNYLLAPTNLQTTVTCHGLQGYFTHSFTKDPNATYEVGGENFGASYASLIE